MKNRIALILFAFAAATVAAAQTLATDASTTEPSPVSVWEESPDTIFDARDVSLDDFKWVARPVVVFADSPLDPAYKEQIELLTARIDELTKRDVVLIVDTASAEKSDIRTKLRPRGFMLTVISKEGRVVLRKPFPWDVREISRSIDKLPIRRQEIRESKSAVE
ncbi:MAG: DUF4174 domain-containing protein [Silicimonas sp.]|nr:DUF4174 domain-containing protein [Silicimonas sp.]